MTRQIVVQWTGAHRHVDEREAWSPPSVPRRGLEPVSRRGGQRVPALEATIATK